MARRKGPRVDGPYKHRQRYRIRIVEADGNEHYVSYSTEEEAKKAIKAVRLTLPGSISVDTVLAKYEQFLRRKGNKPKSIESTMFRLRAWMKADELISDFTPRKFQKIYEQRQEVVRVDTHRNELSQVKTFWRWCVKRRLVSKSPAENVEPIGRRHKGKPQLLDSEGERFANKALMLSQAGDEGALAAYAVLIHGVRNSEIRKRKKRDVDITKNGVILNIEYGKTDAATRKMAVPEPLATLLVEQKNRNPESDWLFPANSSTGYRSSTWLLKNVKRVCKLAGVPMVGPHGLRGTWASITTTAGMGGFVVAKELGHTNPEVTRQHYIRRGAVEQARTDRIMRVLEGGKDATS